MLPGIKNKNEDGSKNSKESVVDKMKTSKTPDWGYWK